MVPLPRDLAYQCKEGQRYKDSAHLLFMDSNFKDAGVYKIKIDTPYDVFVNAMPALGIANKARNELLVTVQYFAIDDKGAHSIAEVGEGWKRMTVLLRLKAVDGKIEAEQDDSCLGNPNHYETIAQARSALKICAENPGLTAEATSIKVAQREETAIKNQENKARQNAPVKFRPWIAEGFRLFSVDEGDLDGDGIKDAAIVLESNDQSIRRLLILKGTSSRDYVLTGRSDEVVPCKDCGGLLSGDPFQGINLGKNRFTVWSSSSGGPHWSSFLTFAWSRLDKQWQLVTLESSEDIPGASDDEQKDCTYKPPKDFGKISLEQIDPEKILKPNAQGMCK